MKKIIILGGGESAIGAALLAKKKGLSVFLSDKNIIEAPYKKILLENKIEFEEGCHSEEKILQGHEIIKSPGISDEVSIIKKIKARAIPIFSEILFARNFTKAKLIAITGTNGKTTTSKLCYHFLKNANYKVGLAGNIGQSFAALVAYHNYNYYVIEISSFQLDDSPLFNPSIAILLNISPDHLDRYEGKFENYINSKWQITSNLKKNDFFIYNQDDPIIQKKLKEIPPKGICLPFSLKEKLRQGAYLEDKQIVFHFENEKFQIPSKDLRLKGAHNFCNVMAGGLAAFILKINKKEILKNLTSFKPLEHRLEPVLKLKGITFINDSKATNVHALRYALESINTPIVLIAGGIDKGNDYEQLRPLMKKIKALIVLGKKNQALIEFFKSFIEFIFSVKEMKEATQKAYELSTQGDTILLSPACASFDLFKDYKDRGSQFKKEAKKLLK